MKYDCELIQDLIPLCTDHMASAASQRAVMEHIEECSECKVCYKQVEHAEPKHRESGMAEQKTADYAALARRLGRRRCRNRFLVILVMLVFAGFSICCLNFAAGYRLTPQAAASLERKLNPESVLLGEYDWGTRKFYFYDCKNYYIITGVNHTWHGWINESYYFVYEKKPKPDAIEITGTLCYWADDREAKIQLLSVRCYDEAVARIEVSFFGRQTSREIRDNDLVIFAIEAQGEEKKAILNTPAGTAYDAEGNVLYYLTEKEDMSWAWIRAGSQ